MKTIIIFIYSFQISLNLNFCYTIELIFIKLPWSQFSFSKWCPSSFSEINTSVFSEEESEEGERRIWKLERSFADSEVSLILNQTLPSLIYWPVLISIPFVESAFLFHNDPSYSCAVLFNFLSWRIFRVIQPVVIFDESNRC